MTRVYTGLEENYASGQIEWSPLPNISSAVWTDTGGSGRGACSVVHPDPAVFGQVEEATHLLIVPTGRDLVPAPAYGPYRKRSPAIQGSSGDVVVSGEIAPHFSNQFIETGSYSQDVAPRLPFAGHAAGDSYRPPAIEAYMPFSVFGDDTGGIGMGGGLYHALLYAAASQVATLSDVAAAFAPFGLVVWPRIRWNGISSDWEIIAEVDSAYPLVLETGGDRRFQRSPYLDAVAGWTEGVPSGFATVPPDQPAAFEWPEGRWHQREELYPSVVIPDDDNRVGAWRRRRQVGAISRLRDGVNLQVHYIGDTSPTEFLQSAFATPRLLLDAAVQRWGWQNDSARLTFTRILPDDYPVDEAMSIVPVLPRQLITFPPSWFSHLPEVWGALRREWRVLSVRHRYDAEDGYSQTIDCALWQGPYVHVSGATQHEAW